MATQEADRGGLTVHERVPAPVWQFQGLDGLELRRRILAGAGAAVKPDGLQLAWGMQRLPVLRAFNLNAGTPAGILDNDTAIAGSAASSPASRCQSACGEGV